jgi:KDO2-lipid IV(A) lauroyltransferase
MTFFPEKARDTFGTLQPPGAGAQPRLSLRQRAGAFWLKVLFAAVGRAPWLARATAGFWVWAAWLCSPALRGNTRLTAGMVLGPDATRRKRARLARGIIRSMYLFVYDVGRHSRMTLAQMRREIAGIDGAAHYDAARAPGRGVILATAHFGAFEAAMAAVTGREKRVHVVFRRDRFGRFDSIRSRLHERLGVTESPIDDGIAAWVRVREALARDEAVLMQADRVMPGQKGVVMPLLSGRIEVPLGPAQLAMMTGAPILPIFAARLPDGRVQVMIEPPIFVEEGGDDPMMEAVKKLTTLIESHVRRRPQQWLVLHNPWVERETPA